MLGQTTFNIRRWAPVAGDHGGSVDLLYEWRQSLNIKHGVTDPEGHSANNFLITSLKLRTNPRPTFMLRHKLEEPISDRDYYYVTRLENQSASDFSNRSYSLLTN